MQKLIAIPLLSLAVLSGCSGTFSPKMQQVALDDQFSVELPESMQKTNELHDFAPLQYADNSEGLFVIGIEEPKSKLRSLHLYYSLEDYAYFVQRTVSGGLDTTNVNIGAPQTVNGMQSLSVDLFGALTSGDEPLEVYYRLAVYESESHFYQLIAWTTRDNYQRFRNIVTDMECSFRELREVETPTAPGDAAETAGSDPV